MEASTTACRVCGEDIKAAAKKCVHCDSYQDWRGQLGLSTEVLSLLVALISVLTIAVPVFVNAFAVENSRFAFSFQRSEELAFTVFVSNEGTRPGVMSNYAVVSVKGDGGKHFEVGAGPKDIAVRQVSVVKPGTSELITLYRLHNGVPVTSYNSAADEKLPDVSLWKNLRCELTFDVTNFDGSDESTAVPVDCAKLT